MLNAAFLIYGLVITSDAIDTVQTEGRKGQLFVYTLHSATFFPTTVEVTWSATLKNRPALPPWLHLVTSRHKSIAYLVGTPVTPSKQVTVHVFAKRLDTFAYAQRYVIISLAEDVIVDTHATTASLMLMQQSSLFVLAVSPNGLSLNLA